MPIDSLVHSGLENYVKKAGKLLTWLNHPYNRHLGGTFAPALQTHCSIGICAQCWLPVKFSWHRDTYAGNLKPEC